MHDLIDCDPHLAPLATALMPLLERVKEVFDDHLSSDLPPVMDLVAHVERYRGKMLRPTLLLVSGMAAHPAADGAPDPVRLAELLTPPHFAVAAVCEMVHMATLVHDDVLDDADTRRRGETVNRLRGNEMAVILGDHLIASAYHLCSMRGTLFAAQSVGRASTVMCAGELLQLHHRGDLSLDEPTYHEIVERKTAALIATATELGAHLSGAGAGVCAAMAEFGRRIGVAFQIQDDLLDLTGEERTVGKSVGKDLEKGKLTLPFIHYLRHAPARERGEALRQIERAAGGGADARRAAAELADTLGSSGSIAYARRAARDQVRDAKTALNTLPPTPARALLLAMADAVVDRAF